jgi:hypothetical protein
MLRVSIVKVQVRLKLCALHHYPPEYINCPIIFSEQLYNCLTQKSFSANSQFSQIINMMDTRFCPVIFCSKHERGLNLKTMISAMSLQPPGVYLTPHLFHNLHLEEIIILGHTMVAKRQRGTVWLSSLHFFIDQHNYFLNF